jgi:hypothetical protein
MNRSLSQSTPRNTQGGRIFPKLFVKASLSLIAKTRKENNVHSNIAPQNLSTIPTVARNTEGNKVTKTTLQEAGIL